MAEREEMSESGSPIYRHEARERDYEAPKEPGRNLESLEEHLEEHIGKVETVFHELISDLVHLDVLFIPATKKRPYQVLVTSGVSDEPMTVPEGKEKHRRIELMMALPADWPLTGEAFRKESNYWPVGWLKQIGRLPHEYETWLGWGHSIPTGDPAEPIADTQFTGFVLLPPFWLPPEFFKFRAASRDLIRIYQVVPVYEEEMALKLKHGVEALEKRFEDRDIDFVIDPRRPNVGKKSTR